MSSSDLAASKNDKNEATFYEMHRAFFPEEKEKGTKEGVTVKFCIISMVTSLFLADERNEAILGLQKSDQHHLHHWRTSSDAKLSKTATKILLFQLPLLAANKLKDILTKQLLLSRHTSSRGFQSFCRI